MSAQTCGCDREADYKCGWYPNCPQGQRDLLHAEAAKYHVDDKSGFIVRANPTPAPSRADLPYDPTERKHVPVASGVLFYFPDAIAEVARVSWQGNEQHNPGQPLHWAREKSTDHLDCIARHLLEVGTRDKADGMRHSAKLAWRALANLQLEIERERDETNTLGTTVRGGMKL